MEMCVLFKESGEKIESMSKKDAAMFPIIASCTLFGLYVFFKVFDSLLSKSISTFLCIVHTENMASKHMRLFLFMGGRASGL